MSKQRIFTAKKDGKTRLIQAAKPAEARAHVLKDFEIEEADSVSVADLVGMGIRVEVANKEME